MSYGILALIVAVGLLGPLLTLLPTRFRPPVVIGEIAAGVIVGRTGTRTLVATQPTLAFLADIGFALLMFIVATNLPLRDTRLRGAARRGLLATAIAVGLAIALGPALAALTGLHRPAVLAVLIASSSAAIVLPIVGTRARDDGLLVTIAWVTFADIATVMAVPFVLSTGGFGRDLSGALLVIAGATAFGLVSRRLVGLQPVEGLRHESHHLAWALDLRLSLLVLFTLAWIAERFDTSALIAGFAAGVMVSLLGEPRRVADQLIGLGEGFFVPLFFVVLGARIDLRALVHSRDDLLLFALLAVAATGVPLLTAAIMRLPLSSGLLAAAEMGVPAAVASLGLATNALLPSQAAAIMAAAALSLAVASVGAIRLGSSPPINPRAPDDAG
ncbi:MAG TPA: cation:proton antiporter [Acidimicrobiia bacterium]